VSRRFELLRGFDLRRAALSCAVALAAAALLCVPGMSLARFPEFFIATAMYSAAVALALTVSDNLRQSLVPPLALRVVAVLFASLAVTLLLSLMQGRDLLGQLRSSAGWQDIGSLASIGVVLGAVIGFVMLLRERQLADQAHYQAKEQLHEKQALQARLRLLQAQVEPHFLFNTLASVQRLIETNPPAASAMLEDLGQYLRAALPDMRETQSTVGRELSLAGAYLGIMRVRMGERLTFRLDVCDGVRDLPFPPTMLLSLVENAIKHGVGDLARGKITVSASAAAGSLELRVSDNGAGFDPHSPAGVGLSNIRERLEALYGSAARLLLEEHGTDPGVTATIQIPHAHTTPT
jgi:signal transduction histidine kinase